MCHRDVVREQVNAHTCCKSISEHVMQYLHYYQMRSATTTHSLTWTIRNCASVFFFTSYSRFAVRILQWQKLLCILVRRQFEVRRIATEMCVRRWWMFKIQRDKLCAKIETKILRCNLYFCICTHMTIFARPVLYPSMFVLFVLYTQTMPHSFKLQCKLHLKKEKKRRLHNSSRFNYNVL